MPTRLPGLLLFLPVPVVLALLTRAPVGPGPSLALALLLVATHPFYARPFALRNAGGRCLWCGGTTRDGEGVAVAEPAGVTSWTACGGAHAEGLRRILSWMDRHLLALRAGIALPLLLLVMALALAAAGRLSQTALARAVAVFQIGIAVTVLPLSTLGARAPQSSQTLRTPFPLHVPALIGMRQVLWLFRAVGVWWLLSGLGAILRP